MSLTFLQLAQKILEEETRPLSPDEIWQIAQAKGYDGEVGSRGKTPARTIGARLYVDVRDNPETVFAKTDSLPKRFVLRSLLETKGKRPLDTAPPPIVPKRGTYLERDLHPFVVYFGFHYLKAYLKTIRHNKSGKKEFGEWVHPDIVGCYFPFDDWKDEVIEVSSLMGNPAVKLFSFELKRELNFSNLREAFFQAVSNSSWANEGYIVAADISSDEDFNYELERLSSSFGIGVIQIDVDDPDSTEIVFPAQEEDAVDWDTINKLTLNPDFRDLLKRIGTDIKSREIRREWYDQVLSKDELIKSLSQEEMKARLALARPVRSQTL
ncbi:MAG: HTH domain-containing protein [Acidobacteriota bacterium]